MQAELQGVRVLVVEDESAVAMLVEDMLEELGCTLAGAAASVAEGLELAAQDGFDIALLDVNLAGERAFPVAALLAERKIPFAFASGYGADGVPAEFSGRPVVGKPFRIADLAAVLSAALATGDRRG